MRYQACPEGRHRLQKCGDALEQLRQACGIARRGTTGQPPEGCALLDLRIAPPEPDQGGEAIDDRSDDPVACER